MLASLKRHVWSRDKPEGWLDLQEYLGKLWIELRLAGVPRILVSRLETAAEEFWKATEDSGDPEIGIVLMSGRDAVDTELNRARGDVYDWLDSGRRPWRRAQLKRAASR